MRKNAHTRHRSRRPRCPRRSRAGALAAHILRILALVALARAPLTPGAMAQTPAAAVQDPVVVLVSAGRTAPERLAAASALLAMGDVAALSGGLSPVASRETILAIAQAIAQRPETGADGAPVPPPDALRRPLIDALDRAAPDDRPALLAALGAFGTRDAVEAAIRYTDADSSPAVRAAACQALIRQTGRGDLAADCARWQTWWREVRTLDDDALRIRLLQAQAARARRAAGQRDALSQRLADTLRQLYAATPQADRAALLIAMMADELATVRRVAFDLADRELLNARSLGENVAAAALDRLTDPIPDLRAAAARLAGNIGSPEVMERVLAVLPGETEPTAAASMLGVAARRPSAALADVALRWLEGESTASSAAADALAGMAEGGLLTDADTRARALRISRSRDVATSPPAMVRLLAALGESADRDRIVPLLKSPDEATRLAAADALAGWGDRVYALVAAATSDPTLQPAAARALTAFRPTAEGYATLSALPATTPDRARQARLRFAEALPPAELLRAAPAAPDDAERAAMLARVLDDPRTDPATAPVVARLLVDLAESRLALDDAAGALVALERLNGQAVTLPPTLIAAVDRARLLALIRLNRLADAAAAPGDAGCWLDGLELCVQQNLPQTRAVQKAIAARFSDRLTSEQARRLDRLTARVGPPPEDGAKAGVGDESGAGSSPQTEAPTSPPKTGGEGPGADGIASDR